MDDHAHSARQPYRSMEQEPPYRRPFSTSAFVAFVWVSMGTLGMWLTSGHMPFSGRAELFYMLLLFTLLGVVLAMYSLVRSFRLSKSQRPYGFNLAIAALPIGTVVAWMGSIAVHATAYAPSYMGRRHRKGTKLFAPESEAGESWLASPLAPLPVPERVRGPLGAEWRDNARKEHASVAAFSHLALDLMAVGAPPHLISASHEDALDEVRHAATCFEIARSLDGVAESPAPFPDARAQKRLFTISRKVALTQIALDALVDGVLNEGIAARLLAQLAARCSLPVLAPLLRGMAADESRHAAHSWEIIEWCLQEGGDFVATALESASRSLPRTVCSALPVQARDGAWETWGVQGVEMETVAFVKTREAARMKLSGMLKACAAGTLAERSRQSLPKCA